MNKLVIVGGGTAGWMAAASFAKLLGKSIAVTLVESDEIATVGVGEATIPPLILHNRLLDINEQEFLTATKGTFKLGIAFEGWRDSGKDYFHSFGSTGKDCWAGGFQHFWLKGLEQGINEPFGNYCLELQAALQNKFSHLPNAQINYAYHIDAGLYAAFLRKIAQRHGVTRIEGQIVEVTTAPQDGHIASLRLKSGELVEGDFFIDCSGFRGLLIEQTLHTGYDDWSHWLPCNSAVAVQTESVGAPVPYTRSIANRAGWQWQIPLQHRVGNGLVYCNRYMSDDEATQLLLSNIAGKPINTPRVIRFLTGQRRQHWNKNCVALGLASGFIEPLESTSIHLIQRGIMRLMKMFPLNGVRQVDVDEFNAQMKFEVENIRDFIVLHYHVTERNDSAFWRFCKNMPIPSSLSHRLRLFAETGKVFVKSDELFGESSWLQVMIGQGLLPQHYHPIVNQMSDAELNTFLQGIRQSIKRTVDQMPHHQDYIDFYCKAPVWE